MRALAVGVAGRLAALNPAYIMPALRKHLMQLLSDMELSPDSKQREGELPKTALPPSAYWYDDISLSLRLYSDHTILLSRGYLMLRSKHCPSRALAEALFGHVNHP